MHQTENKLTGKTREMIDLYLVLPIGAKPSCPYFNNKRRESKSQLRVLKGKGTPHEIVEEAEISAKYARKNIATMSADELKKFLVSEDLGVDCSGFAYHVLDALAHEKTGKSIRSFMKSNRQGFVGSLIARLRPAENMGVASFANNRNSFEVSVKDVRPGDVIIFLGTGKDGLYNHMMVVTEVTRENNSVRISYAHSYSWPTDGSFNHGVREGEITTKSDLLSGTWTEKDTAGKDNYTFESARAAKEVSIRRMNFLK